MSDLSDRLQLSTFNFQLSTLPLAVGKVCLLGLACLGGLLTCSHSGPRILDSRFSRLGARVVASVPVECQELYDFVFSPNGQHVIFTGRISDGLSRTTGVWVGGQLLMRVDSVSEIGFTEGNEPYFVAQDSQKAFVYYRHARPRAYDQILSVSFSRNGEHLAYLTASAGHLRLVVDDGSTQTVSGAQDFALNPTGDCFAYATRDSDDWRVIENSDTSDVYDWVQNLVYSRDGVTLAYAAYADDEWFVVVNGDEQDRYGDPVLEISDVTLSDDGSRLAYVVTELDEKNDETFQYCVSNGYESDVYLAVTSPCLAPTGDQLAFIAEDGAGQFVVTEDEEGTPYDQVWGLSYSPDGASLVYCARDGDEELVVTNDTEHPAHDRVDKMRFSRDGRRVAYGALDDRDFNWVIEEVK
jgi:WD40 repeat protein